MPKLFAVDEVVDRDDVAVEPDFVAFERVGCGVIEAPAYPRGGCTPMTIAFVVASALLAGAIFFAMWWFDTMGV